MAAHLEKEGLQFIQFAFRWVNCLLLREVPFSLAVRLWDTYLAEGCVGGGDDVVFGDKVVRHAAANSAKQVGECFIRLSDYMPLFVTFLPPPISVCSSQLKEFLAYTLAAFLLRCGFILGWAGLYHGLLLHTNV